MNNIQGYFVILKKVCHITGSYDLGCRMLFKEQGNKNVFEQCKTLLKTQSRQAAIQVLRHSPCVVTEGCTLEATILFKLKYDKCNAQVLHLNSNSSILALNTVIYPKQRGLNSVHLARGDIRLLWSKSLPSERRSRSTAMSPQTIPRVVPILVNHKCNFTMNSQKCFDS